MTCNEIYPDQPIEAYGRYFFITGVDFFTQGFYEEQYGRHFDLGRVRYPDVPAAVEKQIPPYNGWGSEADSMCSVHHLYMHFMKDTLEPMKKPKPDFFKLVDNEKKVLRYMARFNTRQPEDVDRRFIISFFLNDDSLSVYEPAQRNSGIVEGPFLKRAQYKNEDKGWSAITPSDLPLGGDVKINGYSYHILSCDDYTKKYLQTHLD